MSLEAIVRQGICPIVSLAKRALLYGSLSFSLAAVGCSNGDFRHNPESKDEKVCGDADNDGYYPQEGCGTEVDCNDYDRSIFPGALEFCDFQDNDCDGQIDEGVKSTFYEDADQDGFGGQKGKTVQGCVLPSLDPKSGVRYSPNNDDCNDNGFIINPAARERCDGIDNNCRDGADETYRIGEACETGIGSCRSTGKYVCSKDGKASYCSAVPKKSLEEHCDGIDNDCDGETDEGVQRTFYLDNDLDGFGNSTETIMACNPPEGYVDNASDCDDSDEHSWFYAPAFADNDRDRQGFGDIQMLCIGERLPEGYVSNDVDCDDTDSSIHVGAVELCDLIDNNCNGVINEMFNDGDSCADGRGDCRSEGTYLCTADGERTFCTAVAGSGSSEECDGRDNDCNGIVDDGLIAPSRPCTRGRGECADSGYEFRTCLGELGWSIGYFDCDAIAGSPVPELCDGMDNNCDGESDNSLIPPTRECSRGIGECADSGLEYAVCSGAEGWTRYTSCNAVPGEPIPEDCDGRDNDCDGIVDNNLMVASRPCTRGLGECESSGAEYQVCNGTFGWSREYSSCDAVPGDPTPEGCADDGLDNDCDGEVDEVGYLDIASCLSNGTCSTLLSDNGEVALDGTNPVAGTSLAATGWLRNFGNSESTVYSAATARSSPLSLATSGYNGAGVHSSLSSSYRNLHASIWYYTESTGADTLRLSTADSSSFVEINTGGFCGSSSPFEYSYYDATAGRGETLADIGGSLAYERNKWYHFQIDAVGRGVTVSIDTESVAGVSRVSKCITFSEDVDWSQVKVSVDRCGADIRISYWDDFITVTP